MGMIRSQEHGRSEGREGEPNGRDSQLLVEGKYCKWLRDSSVLCIDPLQT